MSSEVPTEDDDDTIVSSRRGAEGAAEADLDATAASSRSAPEPAADVDDDDDTVVARRHAPSASDVDDPTVAARRHARPEVDVDATRPMDPEDLPPEGPPPVLGVKRTMAPPAKRRRGELHPAPVPADYGEQAVRASGTGTITTYRSREIPAAPAAPAELDSATVRRITEGGRSVTRHSRQFAVIALSAFAVACLISVVGLVWIAREAFGF